MSNIFSGGTCNYVCEDGTLVRNPNRDKLNKLLRSFGNEVFDPQIDEISHGRKYDYSIDGPAEQRSRAEADVTFYELGDTTQAGVTCLEIMNDGRTGKNVIVWFSGALDAKGRPVFKPLGLNIDEVVDPLIRAHLMAYVKQGNSMRANLLDFLKSATNVHFIKSLEEATDAFRSFGVKI